MTIRDHTVLDDRYALDDLIGQGGMADVYRGTDRVLLRAVAVKVLREISDPVQRDRFVHEARTLAALNHPGLVTLLDAGITADRPYLVLELAEGCSLSGRIADGPLPPEEVAGIGRQLAEGLAYAHEQGVVHRDVKPSNVLLADGRALLVDFGIARLVGETEHHTRTGDAIGSPAYLAPEQVAGEELTPAADIFSLGLVLLEALTGRRAYTGSPVEAAMARLNTAPAIPTSLGPAWRALIARMTHREPANRPSAAEVAEELGTTSGPVASPPAPVADPLEATGELAVTMEAPLVPLGAGLAAPARSAGWWRRRRGRLVAAAALVVAAVAVGVPVLLSQQPTDAGVRQSELVVPANVAARFRAPLADLHRAVAAADGGGAALREPLGAVDDALAAHRYPAARPALRGLIAETQRLDRAGDLTASEAARVLATARRLLGLLPEPAPTSGPTATSPPHTPGTSARPSKRPSPSAPATTPAATPTTAPSSTPPSSGPASPNPSRNLTPSGGTATDGPSGGSRATSGPTG